MNIFLYFCIIKLKINLYMQYYHISKNPLKSDVLIPRAPKNPMYKEDPWTKRVCVSTSLVGCARALNLSTWDGPVYVYVPVNYAGRIVKPTEKQVPDVKCTREKWLMDPVKMKCIGKVVFGENRNKCYISEYIKQYGWQNHLTYHWIKNDKLC